MFQAKPILCEPVNSRDSALPHKEISGYAKWTAQLDNAWSLRIENPSLAKTLALEVLDYCDEEDCKNSACVQVRSRSLVVKAFVHYLANQFGDALRVITTVFAPLEAQDDNLWLARAYGLLGILYMNLGERSNAIDYLLKQLWVASALRDDGQRSVANHNLALLYSESKQYEKAISYFKRAMPYIVENSSIVHATYARTNLATCFIHLRQSDQACRLLEEALSHSTAANHKHAESVSLRTWGLFEESFGNYPRSLQYNQQALDLIRLHGNDYTLILTLLAMGRIYIELKSPARAIQYLKEALATCQRTGHKTTEFEAQEHLSRAYELKHDFPLALHHYKQFHAIKESIFNEESEQTLRNLQVVHETDLAVREAELWRSQNAILEKEVELRTQNATQMAAEVQKAYDREASLSQLQHQIVRTVSHEFRTPLMVISATNDTLRILHKDLSDERRAELQERIRRSIFYISDLLDKVVSASTVNRSSYRPIYEHVSMSELSQYLEKSVSFFSKGDVNIRFVYDLNDTTNLQVDRNQLRQIVTHLVSNAIKFSQKSSPTVFSIYLEEQLMITVVDEGIGIPAEELDSIWTLFGRASNSEGCQGLGIGLYIVKTLVESMNGSVHAESNGENQGSTFIVSVPMNQSIDSVSKVSNKDDSLLARDEQLSQRAIA